MAIYKVSIVVPGRRDVGGIQNLDEKPKPGDIVVLGNETFEIVNVAELMPPRGDFIYLNATCRPITTEKPADIGADIVDIEETPDPDEVVDLDDLGLIS